MAACASLQRSQNHECCKWHTCVRARFHCRPTAAAGGAPTVAPKPAAPQPASNNQANLFSLGMKTLQ